MSLRYWENYIERDICSFKIQTIKNNLRVGRCKTYIFASLWKIGLTLACAYILVPNMTSLSSLFRHLGNETMYGNGSLDYDYGMLYNNNYDFETFNLEPQDEEFDIENILSGIDDLSGNIQKPRY